MPTSNQLDQTQRKIIHADPTKDFFVTMLTRDISLQDCIFDLLDNAIDGARRSSASCGAHSLQGYAAAINFSASEFSISDNCGGISLSDAINYAFHFGKKPGSAADTSGGIGLYGIGMKRAIFKIGDVASIESETQADSFKVDINVPVWSQQADWDFEYTDRVALGVTGTKITVATIRPGVAASFEDPIFARELLKLIARDYAMFIQKGFSISVCGQTAPSYQYQVKSDDRIAPAVVLYRDEDVNIRIVAGLVDELADDIPDELRPSQVDRYGWFIVCNDRVVLAGDKSDKTIWGDDEYKVWHPQYNGFAGFVFFEADDQTKLPWTTTKRSVDTSHPLYRRTLVKLKEITDEFTKYSNARKGSLDEAKQVERSAPSKDVRTLVSAQKLVLPIAHNTPSKPETATIVFKRQVSEIDEVRTYLQRPWMTNKDVGVHVFEYFQKAELGK